MKLNDVGASGSSKFRNLAVSYSNAAKTFDGEPRWTRFLALFGVAAAKDIPCDDARGIVAPH